MTIDGSIGRSSWCIADGGGRRDRGGLCPDLALLGLRHQLSQVLHRRLHVVRGQVRRAAKLPNNAGSLAAVKVVATPRTPSSMPRTPARSWHARRSGTCLPDLVFGCSIRSCRGSRRRDVLLWRPEARSRTGHDLAHEHGSAADALHGDELPQHGGAVAAYARRGFGDAVRSGVKNVPIEVTEAISPLVIWRKEYRQDSGGPGSFAAGSARPWSWATARAPSSPSSPRRPGDPSAARPRGRRRSHGRPRRLGWSGHEGHGPSDHSGRRSRGD